MTPSTCGRFLSIAYAAIVFLGAFLLFQVQPLFGKAILPWFGGTPGVWTTCMLVFQVLLFGGYAYAHLTGRYLTPRRQVFLHLALLFLAVGLLPIAPSAAWKPKGSEWPVLKVVLATAASVGLPYFLLSSTGPLVQQWFAKSHPGQSPYRLYSLSNIGSLLALLSYPFVVEPAVSLAVQSLLWSGLFAAFTVLWTVGAAMMRQANGCVEGRETGSRLARFEAASASRADEPAHRPAAGLVGLWFGLALVPSVLLLATTNRVCLDVAVVPFLWIVPLALYLITFILCFDGERWYSRRPLALAAGGSLLFVCWLFLRGSAGPALIVQATGYFAALFLASMVCHGELAALKPAPQHLTLFYLTISAGGAAGGLFVGLLAPLVFVSYYELHLGILGFGLLYLTLLLREDWRASVRLPAWLSGSALLAILVAATAILSHCGRQASGSVTVMRNFYGVLKVEQKPAAAPEDEIKELFHGWVIHGAQFVDSEKRRIPTAYYGKTSGVGQALLRHHAGRTRHVGIVGLGVGTLAAYGQPGDRYRLYEINPDVVTIAHTHFTFLRDCPAEQTIVTGDARLALEFEEPQNFDILVLDAFSGDAVPVHLLTREAMQVYLKHLKTDGLLAVHISNLHFDLRPVLAGLSQEFGLSYVVRRSEADRQTAAQAALWVLLARYPQALGVAVGLEPNWASNRAPVLWTDDRSNLLEVLWKD
jgi:hypothetical protein